MTLNQIYVHDGVLRGVHEDCDTQTLVLDVDIIA